MPKNNYTDINAKAIDKWVEDGWTWGIPISHDEYLNAKSGKWETYLTASRYVPKHWFEPYLKNGRLDGVKILGLASGGAQQMPIFAALGADVTVADYSDKQLESERKIAQQEGYAINIVKADISKPFTFVNEQFDLIFHPVSNCYIEDIYHVWNECFRVLKSGGVLLAGVDNGFCYLFDDESGQPLTVKNKLPYNPLKDKTLLEKADSVQFSHSLEEQINGQLQAGFILTHLLEDRDRDGLYCQYFPQYIMTRALKPV